MDCPRVICSGVPAANPLAEGDCAGRQAHHAAHGDRVQIVGDDVFLTNPGRIRRGIAGTAAVPGTRGHKSACPLRVSRTVPLPSLWESSHANRQGADDGGVH